MDDDERSSTAPAESTASTTSLITSAASSSSVVASCEVYVYVEFNCTKAQCWLDPTLFNHPRSVISGLLSIYEPMQKSKDSINNSKIQLYADSMSSNDGQRRSSTVVVDIGGVVIYGGNSSGGDDNFDSGDDLEGERIR